ncbi:MAG: endonuclease domain-containing protein [Bacteroidetes bacterium]|nr:endonuclease domain-containing protein [Bacteroidota bacterium]
MKSKFPHYYGASLKTFDKAKQLRKESTPAEKYLWKMLRGRSILGFKFRRQHPVYHFIADFYCNKAKLILEVDGDIHELDHIKEYDKEREETIKELGIRVLRFTNEEVLADENKVMRKIENCLRQITSTSFSRGEKDRG